MSDFNFVSECKNNYEVVANTYIPQWRNISKNNLIRCASKCSDKYELDGYISAIMLKYWGKLIHYSYKDKYVASPEDVHTWIINAIMYAIKKHPWTDLTSSLYDDKNAPDKVVNRFLKSRRATFYQQLNRDNRKINSSLLSLDSLMENYYFNEPEYDENFSEFQLKDFLINLFYKKDYFKFFLLDAISYGGYTNPGKNKKLVTYMLELNNYVSYYSDFYNLPEDKIAQAMKYITNLSRKDIMKKIDYCIFELKHTIHNFL